ncbi:MAG: transposase [Verrucomicrobium sp.]
MPHFEQEHLVQAITFRLADSLPSSVLQTWERELAKEPDKSRVIIVQRRIASYLDAGSGDCWLSHPSIAQLVESALFRHDNQRYRLIAWCVMPNHVHVMIECIPPHKLPSILQSWKGYTSREANKILGRTGLFWQKDYHDRFVRDEKHFASAINYIHQNPVKASLITDASHFPFSSARFQEPRSLSPLPAPASPL